MQKETKKQGKAALIWRFLQGSKAMFVVSILMAMLTALADMLTPQIVRVTVDNVIGATPMEPGSLAEKLVVYAGGA